MDPPRYLQIEPVGQCNLRCRMCPIQYRRDGPPFGPPAFMGFEDFRRLLDGFRGTEELHLQGLGEPMMHPRFFDMVRLAADRGLTVSTNSNLTLLTPARAEACVRSGLRLLCVSVDGARPETYEWIRTGARFETIVKNLELLAAARHRIGGGLPRLRLVLVVMRRNLDELPEIVDRASAWGVDEVSVQHLCHDFGEETLPAHYRDMREFVDEQTLMNEDPRRVAAVFAAARERAMKKGIPLRLPRIRPRVHPPGTPGPKRCDWPWRGAYVSYDGRAMPCCMVSTPDRINFGDMLRDEPETVWNNRAYAAFRDRLASDDPPDICKSCAVYAGTF